MRRVSAAILASIFLSPGVPARDLAAGTLALMHVTVIDMTGAPPKSDRTVVVEGNRIAAIDRAGRVSVPRGARIVDAAGKFLIPGLWDMHVHIRETKRSIPMFVANGVTGVRDMGDKSERTFRWRTDVAAGRLLGPRIVACGPIVDGPDPANPEESISVGAPEEGRRAVQMLAQHGSDCIKVYDRLPRATYFAIVEEAKRRKLPVVGHVPLSVTTLEASDAGQRSVEHLGSILEGSSSVEAELRRLAAEPMPQGDLSEFPRRIAARGGRMLDTYDRERASRLFARLARNRTWQVPTLVVKRGRAFIDDLNREGDERLKYVPAAEREWWTPQKNFFARYRTSEYVVYAKRLFQKELDLVGDLQRAGVPILSGTDVSGAYVYPGFSLHDELMLLVQSGLTPMEALSAATRNPAVFLGELGSQGTVESGKRANLVLLDASPLEDIRNTRRIAAVVLDGRYLGKEELVKMLADAEAAAKGTSSSE